MLKRDQMFGNAASRTTLLEHVGDATPIKQHAHRCPPRKQESMKKQVEYLLEHDLAGLSQRSWEISLSVNSKVRWFSSVLLMFGA